MAPLARFLGGSSIRVVNDHQKFRSDKSNLAEPLPQVVARTGLIALQLIMALYTPLALYRLFCVAEDNRTISRFSCLADRRSSLGA